MCASVCKCVQWAVSSSRRPLRVPAVAPGVLGGSPSPSRNMQHMQPPHTRAPEPALRGPEHCTHRVQPPRVERGLAVWRARRVCVPRPAVRVLGVLPLWLDAVLEQVVRGARLQLAGGLDVVVQAAWVCGGQVPRSSRGVTRDVCARCGGRGGVVRGNPLPRLLPLPPAVWLGDGMT